MTAEELTLLLVAFCGIGAFAMAYAYAAIVGFVPRRHVPLGLLILLTSTPIFSQRKTDMITEVDPEILIVLYTSEGKLHINVQPRDDTPDNDNPAVILAAWINSNVDHLASLAMKSYREHAEVAPAADAVTDVEPRIVGADGGTLQ